MAKSQDTSRKNKAVEQIEKARDLAAQVIRLFPDDARVDRLTEVVELLDEWVDQGWEEESEEEEEQVYS